MEIREIPPGGTGVAFVAMNELRPHLPSAEEFVRRVDDVQRSGGYRLVGAFPEDGQPDALAVAGFRVLEKLSGGRVLYVDDLSTRSIARRGGHAGRLFDWLVDEAQRLGCAQLHLDSGYQRHDAHRFYLRRGMRLSSHHFAMMLAD